MPSRRSARVASLGAYAPEDCAVVAQQVLDQVRVLQQRRRVAQELGVRGVVVEGREAVPDGGALLHLVPQPIPTKGKRKSVLLSTHYFFGCFR